MPDATEFWNFANRLYAAPEVAPACLALQDRQGADVMLLLCCLWAGYRLGKLGDSDLDALCQTAAHWQQRTASPLRQLRRRVKPLANTAAGQAFYEALKKSELTAEELEGRALVACLRKATPQPPAGPDAARHNANQYLAHLGAGEQGNSALAILLQNL